MRKINGRIRIGVISNVILITLIAAVFALSFFPQSVYPIFHKEDEKLFYNGNKNSDKISLMFNVYMNTDVVNGILDVLKEYGVKCTFFLGGCWADDNTETVNRIAIEGHEIANHGYFHKDHSKLSYEKNKEEISITENLIHTVSGVTTRLFAPPSGAYSKTTLKVCEELGYKVIMWSKDTIDWRDKDEELVFTRATKNAAGGDLVLMHPMPHTLNALSRVLQNYQAVQLKAVTVSENIIKQEIESNNKLKIN